MEVSNFVVFLISSCYVFDLSEEVGTYLEVVGVWTVLGAIGLNGVMSAGKTVQMAYIY